MFAYIASSGSSNRHKPTAALARLAQDHNVPEHCVKQLSFSNIQLDYFDTGGEIDVYTEGSLLLMRIGTLINKEAIQQHLQCSSDNDSALILRLFRRGRKSLEQLDGHLAFVVYDSQDDSITVVADRFHRYSVVYSVSEAVYVGSHTFLMHAVAPPKHLDMVSFSQAVHFRWFTGEKKLFQGVQQALPGSIVRIDKHRTIKREAYFNCAFARDKTLDLEHWVAEVDEAIDTCLMQIARQHNVIGVPLSGGVDSSLLLAKAKEHFTDCIAVTARFKNGENPELENARRIAKTAGVRHIIADIDDDYIREFFPTIIGLHEAPPRNYSDIALARSLDALRNEVDGFLYGEGADTFFGLGAVHEIVDLNRLSRPFQMMPSGLRQLVAKMIPDRGYRLRQLKRVLIEGIESLVYTMEKIPYVTPPWEVFPCARSPVSDQALNEHLSHEQYPLGDRAALQLLSTGVMNHIENTGRLASHFGLKMYVPFVLNDLRKVALQLPFEMQRINGAFKPVLRELACRYFDRKDIYADKFGFPTPTQNWLKGPLRERVNRAINGDGSARNYYSVRNLSTMSLEEDFELFWFAICLDELMEQVKPHSEKLLVAA